MKLFNTLTRRKEEFVPLEESRKYSAQYFLYIHLIFPLVSCERDASNSHPFLVPFNIDNIFFYLLYIYLLSFYFPQ